MKNPKFTFSDLIAGYVTSTELKDDVFTLETSDGRSFQVKLSANVYAELLRNLGEPFLDNTSELRNKIEKGRYLYAYGIFYTDGPNDSLSFEAKHIVFVGNDAAEYRFEQQDWWIQQIKELGDFYLHAQFGTDEIDYKNYRTSLNLEGQHTTNFRQETDTISRLVYGFATAYMMTGEECYLEAADKGTEYLIKHLCNSKPDDNTAFWYHALDQAPDKEKKIFASEFGDDYDAIPAYEQIYALAGPTQTYRITGNPQILDVIEKTINLFDKYFLDKEREGYFSHIDPINFDPRNETLGHNRARKNWNSVGDHAPAYLINLVLATDNDRYKQMLEYTADTITKYFPDYANSPFVQEKFHEDWSHDQTWGWQQNRAVVGHNLKIAWNLMRMHSMFDKDEYVALAEKIAELMPEAGGDQQRGGWYDVVERTLAEGETYHRFAWHDRKAWWQQEQGILAYLILAGILNKEEYLKLARESSSFYNAWFLDHESGGVYFNVLANGLPYLLGTERNKGSHSMSGYHSFELTYLASVYSNLLVTKQPMQFFFKPNPAGLENRILRVQPDILPAGSVQITAVTIDGKAYDKFDAEALTIELPDVKHHVKVCVILTPVDAAQRLLTRLDVDNQRTTLYLAGEIDQSSLPSLKKALDELLNCHPAAVTLDVSNLKEADDAGIRTIIFEFQKLSSNCKITISGANAAISGKFENNHFADSATFV
ncbi:AGE family epimerase/isomerase [Paenibacillus agilis]|uniref:N-acyl-D-glucosamine 2-epimerase n=1 Tax=Paenibacillus agilis TaxID=3020863 RepID=A0A559J140_9BACL|nr:AGE family epimerase/isomerase [Paenibacillus agilis]TVX93587.1 N-acyl-D-glucosamine 2-epimerase [Paenibacillus agilis]